MTTDDYKDDHTTIYKNVENNRCLWNRTVKNIPQMQGEAI